MNLSDSQANGVEGFTQKMIEMIGEEAKKAEAKKDLVTWIKNKFYIPETKHDPVLRGRIGLQKYQEDALREILTPDENGNFKYSIVVWSDIKKSGKSTIAAAVNLARAKHTEWGEFYVIANDLKQADSRVAHYLRRGVQLSDELKGRVKMTGYKITMPTGSYIEAIPIDPSGEAGTNADMITFCLDEKTEVLTRAGWKNHNTLSMDDEVATRSPDGVFEWQKPQGIYHEEYSGEMYRISHRSMNALVTPDHRMYGKFIGGRGIASGVNGNWKPEFVEKLDNRFLSAKEASQTTGYYPVTTSRWEGGVADEFVIPATYAKPSGKMIQGEKRITPEDFAEFMGWYLSEGCVTRKGDVIYGFTIGQSKTANPEKRQSIIKLLERMGFAVHEWKGSMNIVVYHSVFGRYLGQFGLSDKKFIPEVIKNMPVEYLSIFLDTFILGDGSVNRFGGKMIQVRSERLRDDLIEVAQKCGYSVSSMETIDLRWIRKPIMYGMYIRSDDDGRKMTKIEKKKWSIEKYKGKVFCPSTKNGVIYVRREGTYYWTGNSELWGANEDAKQNMWAEMTIPPGKHGKAFRWVESYAGFVGESNLLYSLYDLGVKQGELLWPDRLYDVTDGDPTPLELYVNRHVGMICLWNTQPRCPWQTKAYYASEAAIMPESQYLRMHRNQWVTSTETFLPMEWYDACKRDGTAWNLIKKERTPMIVAMDASVSGDTFGVWMGCRHPADDTAVMRVFSQRWKPKHGQKLDYQGTEENPGPELVVRRLIKEYNVVCITYDPYQLHDMATRLRKEGLGWFFSFDQGQQRLLADSQLKDIIRDRRYWHQGDPDDREHFQNADAKLDTESTKIRIVKRAEGLPVDLAVAASMGSFMIMRLNLT